MNKTLQALLHMAYSARRTPYPQIGQQTLGATAAATRGFCGKALQARKIPPCKRPDSARSKIWVFFDQIAPSLVLQGLQP
ncbi:hypothetical protein C4K39_3925 [Pseudomonas sessilinigenes]|nr:hypothetical protein C4K39_3925 [Pseudomonas sessilinigenes]